jgi:hypothetical protein
MPGMTYVEGRSEAQTCSFRSTGRRRETLANQPSAAPCRRRETLAMRRVAGYVLIEEVSATANRLRSLI